MALRRLSTRHLLAVGVLAGTVQAILALPASIVPTLAGAARADFTYETAEGTIWNGALRRVTVSGLDIGDVSFRIDPLSLLRGRLGGEVSASGGAVEGAGYAFTSPNGFLVRDAALNISLDAAARHAFLGEPLKGSVDAIVKTFRFGKSGCREALADLSTNVLDASAQRFSSQGFDLAGTAACDGPDILVSLAGEGADGAVAIALRITPDMAYTLNAEARPVRRDVADALQVLGFERSDGALTIGTEGVIRTAGS